METDVLELLLSSDPNGPAKNGAILLLRAETKSGFKAVHQKLDRMEQRLYGRNGDIPEIRKYLRAIIEQVAAVTEQGTSTAKRVDMLTEQMTLTVKQVDTLAEKMSMTKEGVDSLVHLVGTLTKQVGSVSEQVAILIRKTT